MRVISSWSHLKWLLKDQEKPSLAIKALHMSHLTAKALVTCTQASIHTVNLFCFFFSIFLLLVFAASRRGRVVNKTEALMSCADNKTDTSNKGKTDTVMTQNV